MMAAADDLDTAIRMFSGLTAVGATLEVERDRLHSELVYTFDGWFIEVGFDHRENVVDVRVGVVENGVRPPKFDGRRTRVLLGTLLPDTDVVSTRRRLYRPDLVAELERYAATVQGRLDEIRAAVGAELQTTGVQRT
jgi:hypothetical protein